MQEWDSDGNYQLIERNLPEEWDSAGNNQLIEADSEKQDQEQFQILYTTKVKLN
jgi:hypothetical protein